VKFLLIVVGLQGLAYSARFGRILVKCFERPVDSVTAVNSYVITTDNYNYKDQPLCQNGRAVKVICLHFVHIPSKQKRIFCCRLSYALPSIYGLAMTEETTANP